jgi:hypothetical protein
MKIVVDGQRQFGRTGIFQADQSRSADDPDGGVFVHQTDDADFSRSIGLQQGPKLIDRNRGHRTEETMKQRLARGRAEGVKNQWFVTRPDPAKADHKFPLQLELGEPVVSLRWWLSRRQCLVV